jgi:hypothetical protein
MRSVITVPSDTSRRFVLFRNSYIHLDATDPYSYTLTTRYHRPACSYTSVTVSSPLPCRPIRFGWKFPRNHLHSFLISSQTRARLNVLNSLCIDHKSSRMAIVTIEVRLFSKSSGYSGELMRVVYAVLAGAALSTDEGLALQEYKFSAVKTVYIPIRCPCVPHPRLKCVKQARHCATITTALAAREAEQKAKHDVAVGRRQVFDSSLIMFFFLRSTGVSRESTHTDTSNCRTCFHWGLPPEIPTQNFPPSNRRRNGLYVRGGPSRYGACTPTLPLTRPTLASSFRRWAARFTKNILRLGLCSIGTALPGPPHTLTFTHSISDSDGTSTHQAEAFSRAQ